MEDKRFEIQKDLMWPEHTDMKKVDFLGAVSNASSQDSGGRPAEEEDSD